MDFYNAPSKVDEYEKMCEEYDGTGIYKVLESHLTIDSTLLELGSGPGNDIRYLRNKYRITGSDLSDEFLLRCRTRFSDVLFHKLDAVSIDTPQVFDAIFSNKVLHHLEKIKLEESFKRQLQVIKPNGIFAHTFWLGGKEFTMEGMLFKFYDRDELTGLVSKYFTIRETYDYKEFDEGDSIFIVAENNKYA